MPRARKGCRHCFESLEPRRLLSVTWDANARLVDQDGAAAAFPQAAGTGITVAVVDTGIDYTHPNLGNGFGPGHKVKGGWDFVDNDADPMDTDGHGTSVAGVIASRGFAFDGTYHQGVAPDADLVALRIARGDESVADSTIEQALQWIEANYQRYDISVVNISFGGGRYSASFDNPTLSDDFQVLANLGISVVAAAGNDGVSPFGGSGVAYPAADANVLAAGSVDAAGSISDFSQRGRDLDLLAPGERVATTALGGGFAEVSGTSFSSPFIAGAIALLKQAAGNLAEGDLLSLLRASGGRVDDPAGSGAPADTIFPRLDLDNALALALARAPSAASDVGRGGSVSDMAYDAEGVLHLAYYDAQAGTIRYASRSTTGDWSNAQVIDTTGDDVGAYLSLAVDPLGKPAVAYYDATAGDLVYSHFDGARWQRQVLDSKKVVGQFASLAFDADGDPAVAYYRKTSGDLRLMSFDFHTGAWTRFSVDGAGDVGQYASLAVSQSGTVGIGYADATTGDLKYARWTGRGWAIETVDRLDGVAFISLAFDGFNRPAMSYYDVSPADLKLSSKSSGLWSSQTIGSRGAQGLFTNLWFDDRNAAHLVYFNKSANRLFHLIDDGGQWSAQLIAAGGGRDASVATTSDAAQATYAWWRPETDRLVTGDLA